MNNVLDKKKRAGKDSLPFFLKASFIVSLIIITVSLFLLLATLSFETVPPILNRGIQPATFPKGLLILIIFLTIIVYVVSLKIEWKKEEKLPKAFYITLLNFILFIIVAKILDFFLAISILSLSVSYFWGEKRIVYLLLVSIVFPAIVFIFFETILGLRFPPGIITNIYYN
ncbi:MAG: tripartite tricarboxylate transporter TctB family protein [Pelagibacteraceae bacterium]|jgi:putative tricarboxylic transport membrane protein|nr:tripartite tricarboxylate transporter TctB family protein [Pelagibacteraceae bacterium]